MTATRRNAAASDVGVLQAAARAQVDEAIYAGRIPARPSPQTIAAVADVVAAVDVGKSKQRKRRSNAKR
jgi:hypothetical protein